jgi:uncharacterized damage-inducible protein DinB
METAVKPDLRYPIGKFKAKESYTFDEIKNFISTIETLPAKLRKAVNQLNEQQLNTPYREGGWTVKQVVHHLPDSHMNSYIRFKLAITEDVPTVKTYEESAWAEFHDATSNDIEMSLSLLEALHKRWIVFLRSLKPEQFKRRFNHPENGERNLEWLAHLYAWHSEHHLAHITSLRERMGW